jgi:anti-sigma-K factor RskA
MTCDEVRAHAAAFATGSLGDEERAAVLEHLERCPEAHEEFAQMRAATFMIARAAPEREPPPALRDRILATARAESREDNQPVPISGRAPRWLQWAGAAAAIVVLVAVGFAAGAALRSDGSPALAVRVYNAESGAWLEVEANEDAAEITLGGLPTLEASAAYQLWVIRDGSPQSLAVFEANSDGPWQTSISAQLEAGETLAVTIGPSGGGAAPVGEPVLSSGA